MRTYLFPFAAVILAAFWLVSCKHNPFDTDDTPDNQFIYEPPIDKSYLYHKDVKIFSSDEKVGTMRVFYSVKALGDLYGSDNFRLLEVRKHESLSEALVREKIVDTNTFKYQNPAESEESSHEPTVQEDMPAHGLGFMLIQKPNDGKDYAVSFFHPQIDTASVSVPVGANHKTAFWWWLEPWQYHKIYSFPKQNVEQIVEIARHNPFKRVFYEILYKGEKTSPWTNAVSAWQKIRNGESVQYTRNPCYQFRVRVKSKKRSAYTVRFSY